MKIRGWLAIAVLALLAVGSGCSREDPSVIASPPEEAAAAGGEAYTLEVSAAETALAFAQTELTAPASQSLTVNFTNPAALQHNWVLVQPGEQEAVVQAAQPNGGTVPPGTPGVIVAGPVITNSSEQILVDPLESGEYPYVCTVAGHYGAGMAGTLTVQA